MTQNKEQVLEEIRGSQQERAENWGKHFRNLVREWQYADEEGGRILLNKTDLAKLIKVSDMTIAQWLEGKKYPSRQNCALVSIAFGKPITQILEAAGYAISQDDSYNTMNIVMQAVEKGSTLDVQERKRLYDALTTTITPDWITANPDWIELVRVVLNQNLPPLKKAERIASVVELSRQNKG